MLFNSLEFAIFLPLVFIIYWFICQYLLCNYRYQLQFQNLFVLIASYVFIQNRESPILEFPVMKQYMNYINYADTILFRDNIHFKSDMIPQNYIQRFDQ